MTKYEERIYDKCVWWLGRRTIEQIATRRASFNVRKQIVLCLVFERYQFFIYFALVNWLNKL